MNPIEGRGRTRGGSGYLGALHNFPECEASTNLSVYLGEWLSLVQEQGMDLPQRHLTTLLVKMLPADVRLDVKTMNLMHDPYQQIVQ